jgi:DNA-binding CsgD family transcriptional regulator/tetratricopeptide (TPR) repeat protein
MGTRLIGRHDELAALLPILDAHAGRLVTVSGEAGIGKSRLAAEVLELARQRGLVTLEGRAHPLHAGLAYAPIVQALRPRLAELTSYDGMAGLGRLFGDPRLPAAEPVDDPELDRTLMFEAVARLVGPAILFVDDVHWADHGTIELLHYIGQQTTVLATYRPSEVDESLGFLLNTVRRDGVEVVLEPLPDASVGELAREVLGHEPPRDLLDNVTARAKGIPLFVTALLRSPGPLPPVVRDVVHLRVKRLSERARRLLEIVAVAGDQGSGEVLDTLMADFDTTMRELVRDGLVTEHVSGRDLYYRIAHPLYAETAYSDLTLDERRRAHAAVARAIAKVRPDDVLAIAPHYLGAGEFVDTDHAIDVLTAAGRRAKEINSSQEALRYLGAALDEARAADRMDLVISLLDTIGRVHQGAGRLPEAAEAWSDAVAVATRAGRAEQVATIAYWLALLESERGNLDAAKAHVRTAVDAVADPELALLRMYFAFRHGDVDQVRAMAEQMPTEVGTYLGRALVAAVDSDFETAHAAATTSLELSRRTDERIPHMVGQTARRQLTMIAIMTGDMPAAVMHARADRDETPVSEFPTFRCTGHYYVAFTRYLSGEIPEALAEIDKGIALAARTGMLRILARTLVVRALLLAEQGSLAEAREHLDKAERACPGGLAYETSLSILAGMARTVIALHSGEPFPEPTDLGGFRHDPLGLVFGASFAGYSQDNRASSIARLRDLGRTSSFADALADRFAGQDHAALAAAADRLEAMGAHGFAAQARLESAELSHDRDALTRSIEVFTRAGMTPWRDRALRLARELGVRVPVKRTSSTLTSREQQIVTLVGDGLSNADIAARLYLSQRTVESHLRNSYAKLGLTSRLMLARWAREAH